MRIQPLLDTSSPLFKFGFNPLLINGILNVLTYEQASLNDYEKSKNGHGNGQIANIFCDLCKANP